MSIPERVSTSAMTLGRLLISPRRNGFLALLHRTIHGLVDLPEDGWWEEAQRISPQLGHVNSEAKKRQESSLGVVQVPGPGVVSVVALAF